MLKILWPILPASLVPDNFEYSSKYLQLKQTRHLIFINAILKLVSIKLKYRFKEIGQQDIAAVRSLQTTQSKDYDIIMHNAVSTLHVFLANVPRVGSEIGSGDSMRGERPSYFITNALWA